GLQRSQEKCSICPSLQDFSFTSWNPEQDDDCPDFDADYEEGSGDGEVGAEEHKDGCEASGSRKTRDVIPIGEADIATMCLQLSSQPREYSYFSPRTMATWAGPGYWQFKPKHKREWTLIRTWRHRPHDHRSSPVPLPGVPVDHLPDKETRKRKPKKTFEIDFSHDVNFDSYFRTTRVRTFLLSSALSVSGKKTTLPADFQFPPETLSQLSLKPSSSLSPEGQRRLSAELGEAIGDYDYNNANDTANFCPGVQV
ncbi:unnamed protein product, partial [Tetraodon nigroviridis]